MTLRLHNTLSRSVTSFEPLAPPRVTFYMCGPTVWNYAHVGNFRTFLFGDVLRRYLQYSGYEVFTIMNVTDVDDRTIRAAAESGITLAEHTEPFVTAFFEDRDYLRIRPADVYPCATRYIQPMIELVERLLERGLAYASDDGSVYYSLSDFKAYGRLSRVERRELKVGARVVADEYSKEDAHDFALWKAAGPDDEKVGAAWDAPFGRGRPGWHLECSAMALGEIQRFGVQTLDIHAGGIDLTFPHHENEIAQSEGATGQTFARFWLHGEFLTVEGTKMSKRLGNVLTVRDLREGGVDAAAFRMLLSSTHYRQRLKFTDDALGAATEGVRRLGDFHQRLREVAGPEAGTTGEVAAFEDAFRAAMDDDLNIPEAIGALFTFVRMANRQMDSGTWLGPDAKAALDAVDRVMDVLDLLPMTGVADEALRRWVEERLAARGTAREARDYAAADAIRAEIAARGIELEDTADGTRWRSGKGKWIRL